MEGLGLLIVVGLRPAEPGEDPGLLGQIVSDPLATVIRPAPLSMEAAARLLRESPVARGRRRLLRRLPGRDGRQSAALARAHARDRRRGSGSDRGERAPPARARGAGRLARRLASPLPPSAGSDERSRRRSRSWATTPIPARRRRWPTWTRRPPPRRPARSRGSTSCARSRRSGSSTHSSARRSTRRSHRSSETSGTHGRRVSSPMPGRSRNGSPRTCCALPRPRIQQVVAVLREAARRAASRGASESAVAYLRRALAEPPAAAERADLLLELGTAEALVSGNAAVEHLREAHALIDDPIRRAETALAARPRALPPPPRRGVGRRLHRGAGRARRRRRRARAPPRGGAHHQHHVRAVSSTARHSSGWSASAGGPRTGPSARRSCSRCSPITMRGRARRPQWPSLSRAARLPRERWSRAEILRRRLRSPLHGAGDGGSRRSSGDLRGRTRRGTPARVDLRLRHYEGSFARRPLSGEATWPRRRPRRARLCCRRGVGDVCSLPRCYRPPFSPRP